MNHIEQVKELETNGDKLTIYIVSKSSSKETFWCFLAKPEELDTGSEIYANSSARLTIDAGSTPEASFGIPVQFKLAAKSINHPVGLGIEVSTRESKDVQLEDVWQGTFYTGEEHQAPDLTKVSGQKATENHIEYKTNKFEPDDVIANQWYPSQSYGMKTDSGFVGMTWDARPGKVVKIEPLVKFYVSAADYQAGTLANLTTISDSSAVVELSDFSGKAVTVTYLSNGDWDVKPGRPKQALENTLEKEKA
ncbi:hypothetical protein [Photobacterium atrarenae]|uniref:Uncharacterized protein n=1 Tax=Photobacterium atrarenae TaxID=865757 RepID=A0ABY5GQH1_9GAMM|nr:hypothetical protein [Photobacterium atrarenae]UTV30986.1 hypothetical protein NNL38_24580 [Photobacterium atrarenae]